MKMSIMREKVAELPQNPGVYFFRGTKGKILYIGKATNLRTRVQSYFRGVIQSAAKNPDKITDSEISKGILKQLQDDTKIVADVAGRSEWIGVMIGQVADIDFQETDSVLEALILESNLIKKHQPKYNTLEKDDKSFSYFVITKEEFPRVLILRKTDLNKYVIPRETRNPDNSTEDDINTGILRYAQNDSRVESKKLTKLMQLKATFGPYASKHQMQVALKIIRRIFPFHALKQQSEKGCLDFQIGMCPGPYAGAILKEDYAKNIHGIKMILEGKKKRLVTTLEKEMQAFARKNEFEKAAELRNKIFALNHIRDVALMSRDFEGVETRHASSLQGIVRIEAYDISNISGQHAVGSMVVFENGAPNKSQYRKFKIKTVEGSNDVAMMREVLLRRFKNDWAMPDLVLLDGGVGHVNMATKLLREELGLNLEIFGVAKGPTRKKLEIIRDANPQINANPRIANILQDNNLIKSIMDEAHRFAIKFHRKLRRKNAIK